MNGLGRLQFLAPKQSLPCFISVARASHMIHNYCSPSSFEQQSLVFQNPSAYTVVTATGVHSGRTLLFKAQPLVYHLQPFVAAATGSQWMHPPKTDLVLPFPTPVDDQRCQLSLFFFSFLQQTKTRALLTSPSSRTAACCHWFMKDAPNAEPLLHHFRLQVEARTKQRLLIHTGLIIWILIHCGSRPSC